MGIFDNEQTPIIQSTISVTAPAASSLIDNIDKTAVSSTAVNYYFDIISEQSIELNNQITDNYVENNTAIQDHIAQNPLVINISGLSGEKVFKYDPQVMEQLLSEARIESAKMGSSINLTNIQADNFWELVGLGSYAKELNKLSVIPELYPPVSNYMQVAMNAVELADAAVAKYKNIYDSIFNKESNSNADFFGIDGSTKTDTRLKEIFNNLQQLRKNNTALIISTPYGIFPDMYIQSVRLRQGNELYTTDIEMTLKQLRFSNVTTTAADKDVMAKLNAYQRANIENNGITQGEYNDSYIGTLISKYRGDKYYTAQNYKP